MKLIKTILIFIMSINLCMPVELFALAPTSPLSQNCERIAKDIYEFYKLAREEPEKGTKISWEEALDMAVRYAASIPNFEHDVISIKQHYKRLMLADDTDGYAMRFWASLLKKFKIEDFSKETCARCGFPDGYLDAVVDPDTHICSVCSFYDKHPELCDYDYLESIFEQKLVEARRIRAEQEKTLCPEGYPDSEDDQYITRDIEHGVKYDCVVAISGGKDSVYMVYKLVKDYGLRVLCVREDVEENTVKANENIDAVIRNLRRKFPDSKVGYVKVGHRPGLIGEVRRNFMLKGQSFCKACLRSHFGFVYREAIRAGVPMVLFGLNRAQVLCSEASMKWANDMIYTVETPYSELDRERVKDIYTRRGTRGNVAIGYETPEQMELLEVIGGIYSQVSDGQVPPIIVPYYLFNRSPSSDEMRRLITQELGWEYPDPKTQLDHSNCKYERFNPLFYATQTGGVDAKLRELASLLREGQLSREDAGRIMEVSQEQKVKLSELVHFLAQFGLSLNDVPLHFMPYIEVDTVSDEYYSLDLEGIVKLLVEISSCGECVDEIKDIFANILNLAVSTPAESEKFYFSIYKNIQTMKKDLAKKLEDIDRSLVDKVHRLNEMIKFLARRNFEGAAREIDCDLHFTHRQNMQIWGISIDDQDPVDHRVVRERALPEYKDRIRYHEVFLLFGEPRETMTMEMHLCQKYRSDTPYHFDTKTSTLFYYGSPVPLKASIQGKVQRSRKGYYFPFTNASDEVVADDYNPYRELRLNPLTKYCAGRCKFCQRRWYLPIPSELENRHYIPPEELIPRILEENPHLRGTFEKVEHITYITNLYAKEKKYLDDLEKTISLLREHGFKGTFYACSTIVRTPEGIKRFHEIVNGYMYPFIMERFTNREELMGKIKGIKFDEIVSILERARTVGFTPTGRGDDGKIHITYIAGLEPYEVIEKHFRILKERNLIDTVGFNMMAPFIDAHYDLMVPEAMDLKYYYRVRKLIKDLGFEFYDPGAFNKGNTPIDINGREYSGDVYPSVDQDGLSAIRDVIDTIPDQQQRAVFDDNLYTNPKREKYDHYILSQILLFFNLGKPEDFKIEILEGGVVGYSIILKSTRNPEEVYVVKTDPLYSEEDIMKQQQVLNFLATRGFPVSQYVEGKDAAVSFLIDGKRYTTRNFVQGKANGSISSGAKALAEYYKSIESFPAGNFARESDLAISKCHVLMKDFRANVEQLKGKKYDEKGMNYNEMKPWLSFLDQQMEALRVNLEKLGFDDLPDYMIHGDFRKSNVIFNKGRPSVVIDFDIMRYEKKIFEVVYAALSFCNIRFYDIDSLFKQQEDIVEFFRIFSLYYPLSEEEIRLIPEIYRAIILQRIYFLPYMHGVDKKFVFEKSIAALQKMDFYAQEWEGLITELLDVNGKTGDEYLECAACRDLLGMLEKKIHELKNSRYINHYEYNQLSIIVYNINRLLAEDKELLLPRKEMIKEGLSETLILLDSFKEEIQLSAVQDLQNAIIRGFLVLKAPDNFFNINSKNKILELVCAYLQCELEHEELVQEAASILQQDNDKVVTFLEELFPVEMEIRLKVSCKSIEKGKRVYHITGKTPDGQSPKRFLKENAHSLNSKRTDSDYTIAEYITEYIMPEDIYHEILRDTARVRVHIHEGMPHAQYIDEMKRQGFNEIPFRDNEYEPQYRNRSLLYREGTSDSPPEIHVVNVLGYTNILNLVHFYLIAGVSEIVFEDHFPDYDRMMSMLVEDSRVNGPVDVVAVGSSFGSGMRPPLPEEIDYCYFEDTPGRANPYQFRWLRYNRTEGNPAYLAGFNFNLREMSNYSLRMLMKRFPEASAFLSTGVVGYLSQDPEGVIQGYQVLPGDIFVPRKLITDTSEIEIDNGYLEELKAVLEANKVSYVVIDMEDKTGKVIEERSFNANLPCVKILLGNIFSVNSVASETNGFMNKLRQMNVHCIDMELDQFAQTAMHMGVGNFYLGHIISDIPGFVSYGEQPTGDFGDMLRKKIGLASQLVSLVAHRIIIKEGDRNQDTYAGLFKEYRSRTLANRDSAYYRSAQEIESERADRRLEHDFWDVDYLGVNNQPKDAEEGYEDELLSGSRANVFKVLCQMSVPLTAADIAGHPEIRRSERYIKETALLILRKLGVVNKTGRGINAKYKIAHLEDTEKEIIQEILDQEYKVLRKADFKRVYARVTIARFLLTIRTKAKNCSDIDEELVIALDTDIGNLKEYAKELLEEFERMQEVLKKEGLNNVRIFVGEGDDLEIQISRYLEEKGDEKKYVISAVVKNDNIIKRGLYRDIKDKVHITAINDTSLPNDNRDKLNYIPIIPIIELSIEKAVGSSLDDIKNKYSWLPNLNDFVEENGVLVISILPKAEPIPFDKLRKRYVFEAQVLSSA